MIWFDIGTPKYAMFFSSIIPFLEKLGRRILVTTRFSPNYNEAKEILDINGIAYEVTGNYGGSNTKEKFIARIDRQKELMNIFDRYGYPKVLISGCVADSVQLAFGVGIPIVNIYDTPIADYVFDIRKVTAVSRLTIPFSTVFFYPYILPKEIFWRLGLDDEQLIPYNFIDVCLWMKDIKRDEKNDFRKKVGLDVNRPTIAIREEEYKAHYVKERLPVIYELIPKLAKEIDANIVIIPRYEKDYLIKEFSMHAVILEKKLRPEELYPFIDVFIGGGGTMNLEAIYYGVPTISTRSLWLFHDKYLIDNNLMHWVRSSDDGVSMVKELIGTKLNAKEYFHTGGCSSREIMNFIDKLTKFIEKL